MTGPHNEVLRKVVHIGFGLFILTLKFLTPLQAAAVAASAVLFNRFLLPPLLGRFISRSSRGYDRGILLYPLVVLALILIFRDRVEIAGAIWAILAFGDGAATLAGRLIGGRRLPWNEEKSLSGTLAFFLAGVPTAWLALRLLEEGNTFLPRLLIVVVTVLICAVVESLPLGIDDNLSMPLAGAFCMASLYSATRWPQLPWTVSNVAALVVAGALSVLAYRIRSVSVSGLFGGWVLAATLILLGHWSLFAVLTVFFVLGTGATKLGYRTKLARGLAQEKGGRRGFSHAFANVGVAAICAVMIALGAAPGGILFLAAVASLATAATDTVGSEIGQWVGRSAFLPLTFRRVPPGTEGAVSVEGTVAGWLGGFLVALAGVFLMPAELRAHFPTAGEWLLVTVVTLAAMLGSYLESLAGNWNRKREEKIPNGVLNFFNTMIGAIIAAAALAAFVV